MSTIHDVARLAGVSIGTVSRVLSGNPATSPESRERVREAALQLGYTPNARAQSLRLARTGVIGLSISDVRNPFFADAAHGAEQEALAAGRVTMLANADEDSAIEARYLRAFRAQRVDGVLMSPQGGSAEGARSLVEAGIPVVLLNRTLDGVDAPVVTFDVRQGIEQAIMHLRDRGHRRIGLIAGPVSVSTGRARVSAFESIRDELGLDPAPELVQLADGRRGGGADAAERLLDLSPAPTAVLSSNALMSSGAFEAIRGRGAAVELVSFDDQDWMRLVDPPLSVIEQDAAHMGAVAMRLLLELIDGGSPRSVTLPTRLIPRG
ncbi:LacI family DNA-binding transcriptional regulator [Agromyces soli]|uniref:LacI family transcriptional regulator n=1 Tax=Agromyces soli TaxID=659012 RepID=A0ABY4AXD8_9MICO|nr:LacI family DNA-binding transcriptional regulator [Agromyces soli]UOE26776.1 LacI family transcriptional regulator [Agromyces soli]